jgi:hypothetical protein
LAVIAIKRWAELVEVVMKMTIEKL